MTKSLMTRIQIAILILRDWRLSLNAYTMEYLLRISVEGVPVQEFDPLPVVTQWRFSGCKMRRPQITPYGPRPNKEKPKASSSLDEDIVVNSDSDANSDSDKIEEHMEEECVLEDADELASDPAFDEDTDYDSH